jgi:phenylacetate-CoA ligase
MTLMNSAKSLPYPLKQGLKYVHALIPLPIRCGKVFSETYAFLQKSQWWSRERREEYLQQLSKLLHHACENVPYYEECLTKGG